jgi:peptidoglycan/xylan/chitin deacetylase (PgdA/CDA1 family)
MIGVIAKPSEFDVVREFFELFKTPWEWYQSGRRYEVLLCTWDDDLPDYNAELVVIYGGQALPFDAEEGLEIVPQERHAGEIRYRNDRIPIYGDCISFRNEAGIPLQEEIVHPAIYLRREGAMTVARIGYNLFQEVQTLLAVGQPVANAGIPTLELHIALLRDLIVTSGASLVEIPPVPNGYRFIACLTHDVDHPSIRRHKFDHTTLGFLYRAVLVSLAKAWRKQLSLRGLLRNCIAALKLPLVHLGLAKDFWDQFDRYLRLEEGLPSTFFVIPYGGRPGRLDDGPAPSFRAARYGAADIKVKIRDLMSAGCEIGVHGIDAWIDSSSGRAELEVIRGITGMQSIGARMHWLYFGESSPLALDEAGADYDSTIGYNGTVGYRAGTTQAYKPLGVSRLLELPLHIMDTAMFFPVHLNLSPGEAYKRVGQIVDNVVQLGGAVTVNWHDRSIAPERCWDDFYVGLVRDLRSKGAWFATAADTVSWFRQRRSAVFEIDSAESDLPRVKTADGEATDLPALQLRVYNVRQAQLG